MSTGARTIEITQGVEVSSTETRLASSRVQMLTRLTMFLLLTLFLTVTTFYNLAVPIGEAPDEPDHVGFVQILRNTGQLPTIPKDSPRYSYEAEQPPLYYLLQAGWISMFGQGNNLLPVLHPNPNFSFGKDVPANVFLRDYSASDTVSVHLMRALSTLISLGALVFIWLAARTAWPDDSAAALIALGFAALLPGFTFTSGTVSNDSLAACAGAGTLYFSLRMLRQGMGYRVALLAGVVMGLGLLSKRSMLVILPLLALVCLISPARGHLIRLKSSATLFLVAFVVGAWPFVSNVLTYGDPLATQVTLEAKSAIASPLANMPGFWLVPGYFMGLFDSLWGVFGLRSIEMPGLIYAVYYGLCILAIPGLIVISRRASRGSTERRVLLILVLTLVLIYAGVAFQNSQLWAIQGRLLLPGLAALALLVGRGLSHLGRQLFSTFQLRAGALATLLLGLLTINVYALVRHILLVYYA